MENFIFCAVNIKQYDSGGDVRPLEDSPKGERQLETKNTNTLNDVKTLYDRDDNTNIQLH